MLFGESLSLRSVCGMLRTVFAGWCEPLINTDRFVFISIAVLKASRRGNKQNKLQAIIFSAVLLSKSDLCNSVQIDMQRVNALFCLCCRE